MSVGVWRSVLMWMSAGLLVLSIAVWRSPAIGASHEGGAYCAGPAELAMLSQINDFRAGRGLEPLGLSGPLGAAATHKSQAMASEGFFRHVSPDGVTPRELLRRHGYEHNTSIGENIAAGQESARATFVQWRESASHRELMADEAFVAVGIARAYNVEREYDWYWTAEFGGVLAEPATGCEDAGDAATPAGTPGPVEAVPVRLICDGVRLPDGTYDLTCEAATSHGARPPM